MPGPQWPAERALSLESLIALDGGKVSQQFMQELAACVKDMQQRAGDDRARKVNLTFDLRPKADLTGTVIDLASVDVIVAINHKLPPKQTITYRMNPKHDGRLGFQPDSPDDEHQAGMFPQDPAPRRDDDNRPRGTLPPG